MLACQDLDRLFRGVVRLALVPLLALFLIWGVAGAPALQSAAPPVAQRPAKPWTGTIDTGTIYGLALSRDGHTLVTSTSLKVASWDLRTGKLVRERNFDRRCPSAIVFVNGD